MPSLGRPRRERNFAILRKNSSSSEEFYNFIWTAGKNVLNILSRTQARRKAQWFCDLLVTRNNPFGLVAGRIPKVGLSGPVSRGGSLVLRDDTPVSAGDFVLAQRREGSRVGALLFR
jgi:hypothetical protein